MAPDPDLLSDLRERVALLQVLPCRLAHERVIVEDGIAKRRIQGTGQEPVLVRVGLCPAAVRSRQLSCAHTRAHTVLEQALGAAAQAGAISQEEAEHMGSAVRRIAHAIHMTDLKKNATEVRYALLVERQAEAGVASAREELDTLIGQHSALSAELGLMREWLLERLDPKNGPAIGQVATDGA